MTYLYDWIKENKRTPTSESELSNCAYAKREFKWLMSMASEIKDSHAWYIKQVSEEALNLGNPLSFDYIKRSKLAADDLLYVPFDWMYSFMQMDVCSEKVAYYVLKFVVSTEDIKYLELTQEELKRFLTTPQLENPYFYRSKKVVAQFLNMLVTGLAAYEPQVVKYLTPRFYRSLEITDLAEVRLLVADTVEHDLGAFAEGVGVHSITSMRDLKRKHDARAAKLAEEEMKAAKEEFVWTPEFEEYCARFGWKLPGGKRALLIRGNVHHNCVGSYAAKMMRPKYNTIEHEHCILMFNELMTSELALVCRDGKVDAIGLRQCKGLYNKDYPFERLNEFKHGLIGWTEDSISLKIKEPSSEGCDEKTEQ